LPPKDDQRQPEVRTVAGAEEKVKGNGRGQRGEYLTTATGTRLYETDHSLTAGERGPTLLQDHHLREKITHFDHERIPERVVHARGAAAHGTFLANGAAENICKASLFASGARTPVFVRFSTVLGSRGSADTVRDTRGFATKFYTDEGVFDLVGNNIPVFFIQTESSSRTSFMPRNPHPDREIPQAQSAHDTFWDFVSLHTEATAHTLWNMSDRGIPRSYRMMEGFGIHTFRLVNADGETNLVKFHWKPAAGVHSLVWEEAQIAGGVDPDFHRRDLADAIEAGAYPSWDLGVQVFPDTEDEMFEGIDLLDPTKIVPEELAPVQVIGTMTLDANPTNFFAEDRAGRIPPGSLGSGRRHHQRSSPAGAFVLVPRHPDHATRWPQLRPDSINVLTRLSTTCFATASIRTVCIPESRRTIPIRWTVGARSWPRRTARPISRCPRKFQGAR
jgi:catalase